MWQTTMCGVRQTVFLGVGEGVEYFTNTRIVKGEWMASEWIANCEM